MSNSFSSSSQYRLCLARLTFIRQYHFPRGLREHTMQLKCQGTSVYLCGYPYNETHKPSLHSEVTFFSKWRLHPSAVHSLGMMCGWWVRREKNRLTERVLTWMKSLLWEIIMQSVTALPWMRAQTFQWCLQHFIAAMCGGIFLIEFVSSHSKKCWHAHRRSLDSGRPSLDKVWRESNQAPFSLWHRECPR